MQQTCKALFKNFTQIRDALQSRNTLPPHFRVFLGGKGIHHLKNKKFIHLQITAHHNELLHLDHTNEVIFVNIWHVTDTYLSEPVHHVKQSTTNDLSICLI